MTEGMTQKGPLAVMCGVVIEADEASAVFSWGLKCRVKGRQMTREGALAHEGMTHRVSGVEIEVELHDGVDPGDRSVRDRTHTRVVQRIVPLSDVE